MKPYNNKNNIFKTIKINSFQIPRLLYSQYSWGSLRYCQYSFSRLLCYTFVNIMPYRCKYRDRFRWFLSVEVHNSQNRSIPLTCGTFEVFLNFWTNSMLLSFKKDATFIGIVCRGHVREKQNFIALIILLYKWK